MTDHPLAVQIDGASITVESGSTLLQACDAAGRYVPRLCHHPAVTRVVGEVGANITNDRSSGLGVDCGLCLVRLGDGSVVRACLTEAIEGIEVSTVDDELCNQRASRLAEILTRHPHVCLTCPDREGCGRVSCSHGVAVDARCCDKLGVCELGAVVEAIDPEKRIPRRGVSAPRAATTESRIRREPGLCVVCGRCVRICASSPDAGRALEIEEVARPKGSTLRESGCSFCGQCVLVCPTGAVTAPGPAGAEWLLARGKKYRLLPPVLPSDDHRLKLPEELNTLPREPGVFILQDDEGQVLRIGGVADVRSGVEDVLGELQGAGASWIRFEVDPLYTQRETELLARHVREHGRLPDGNDLGDDLFNDDLG